MNKQTKMIELCKKFIDDPSIENYKKIKTEILDNLTFEERLEMSKEQDLY